MGYTVIDIGQIEGAGPGGAVRFVRRQLGVEAFGVNWFELPPNTPGREHDETGTGQEEVNIVISGGGIYRIDGEQVPVQAPMALRFDPETVRQPVAGPDGLTMVAIGARRGSYEPHGPF
jgi:hypothetical protein